MVKTLDGTLGIWYPILFNAIGVISIFLQFMIFQLKRKKQIVFVGILSDIGWLLGGKQTVEYIFRSVCGGIFRADV